MKPETVEPRGDCFVKDCMARAILSNLSSRWGGLIIAALRGPDSLRFSELRKRIEGISEKMLAQKLRELERDGLIIRTAYNVVPPHVDYRLSQLGAGAAKHVEALVRWIESRVTDFAAAQRRYDKS